MRACLASIAALLCLILPEKGDACRRRCVRQVCAPAPLRLPKEAIAPRDFALIPALGGPETYFATMAEAVAAARQSVQLTENRYKAGTASFLDVIARNAA